MSSPGPLIDVNELSAGAQEFIPSPKVFNELNLLSNKNPFQIRMDTALPTVNQQQSSQPSHLPNNNSNTNAQPLQAPNNSQHTLQQQPQSFMNNAAAAQPNNANMGTPQQQQRIPPSLKGTLNINTSLPPTLPAAGTTITPTTINPNQFAAALTAASLQGAAGVATLNPGTGSNQNTPRSTTNSLVNAATPTTTQSLAHLIPGLTVSSGGVLSTPTGAIANNSAALAQQVLMNFSATPTTPQMMTPTNPFSPLTFQTHPNQAFPYAQQQQFLQAAAQQAAQAQRLAQQAVQQQQQQHQQQQQSQNHSQPTTPQQQGIPQPTALGTFSNPTNSAANSVNTNSTPSVGNNSNGGSTAAIAGVVPAAPSSTTSSIGPTSTNAAQPSSLTAQAQAQQQQFAAAPWNLQQFAAINNMTPLVPTPQFTPGSTPTTPSAFGLVNPSLLAGFQKPSNLPHNNSGPDLTRLLGNPVAGGGLPYPNALLSSQLAYPGQAGKAKPQSGFGIPSPSHTLQQPMVPQKSNSSDDPNKQQANLLQAAFQQMNVNGHPSQHMSEAARRAAENRIRHHQSMHIHRAQHSPVSPSEASGSRPDTLLPPQFTHIRSRRSMQDNTVGGDLSQEDDDSRPNSRTGGPTSDSDASNTPQLPQPSKQFISHTGSRYRVKDKPSGTTPQQQQPQPQQARHNRSMDDTISSNYSSPSSDDTLGAELMAAAARNQTSTNVKILDNTGHIHVRPLKDELLHHSLEEMFTDVCDELRDRYRPKQNSHTGNSSMSGPSEPTKSEPSDAPRRIFIPKCIIWLSGPPGSGKTSLIAHILEECNLPKTAFISVSDICSQVMRRCNGELDVYEEYKALMSNVLNGYKNRYGIVVDGFFKTKQHAFVVEFLGRKLKDLFSLIRFVVIALKVDENVSVERQLKRVQNAVANPNMHTTIKTSDCSPEEARKRYRKYAEWLPEITGILKKSFSFQEVNGNHPFAQVKQEVSMQIQRQMHTKNMDIYQNKYEPRFGGNNRMGGDNRMGGGAGGGMNMANQRRYNVTGFSKFSNVPSENASANSQGSAGMPPNMGNFSNHSSPAHKQPNPMQPAYQQRPPPNQQPIPMQFQGYYPNLMGQQQMAQQQQQQQQPQQQQQAQVQGQTPMMMNYGYMADFYQNAAMAAARQQQQQQQQQQSQPQQMQMPQEMQQAMSQPQVPQQMQQPPPQQQPNMGQPYWMG